MPKASRERIWPRGQVEVSERSGKAPVTVSMIVLFDNLVRM